ncbi:phosphatidate phosphatase PAH2-like isoform X2 [Phragmites australis]|uniref:phosphatidate phosphatase PAH2-like isoform X2 n=1 Tax=Phragmites australis TaxID=29695 RepID=UPI002D77A22D|nr:phosphatidate phosphatase PAH2-like isoform X2 [Phragmites australis]
MNVVGRVGSLISQGVYSVATPFHPFGGAVDIIVVEQPDGSYRSTPWYVRFGKFQGVLKGAVKVVTITVNGVEASFHMLLDNSGQAYFMRELVPGSEDPGTGSEEEAINEPEAPACSKSDGDLYIGPSDRLGSQELNVEHQEKQTTEEFESYDYGRLEEAEYLPKQADRENSEVVLVSVDGHVLTAPISSTEEGMDDVQLSDPQFHLGPGQSSSGDFSRSGEVWEAGILGDLCISQEKVKFESGHRSEILEEHGEVTIEKDKSNHISVDEDEALHVSLNEDEVLHVSLNEDEAHVVSINEDEAQDTSRSGNDDEGYQPLTCEDEFPGVSWDNDVGYQTLTSEDESLGVLGDNGTGHQPLTNEHEAHDISENKDEDHQPLTESCDVPVLEKATDCMSPTNKDEVCDLNNEDIKLKDAGASFGKYDTFKSCLDLTSQIDDGDSGPELFSPESDHQKDSELNLGNRSVVETDLDDDESKAAYCDQDDPLQEGVDISTFTSEDNGTRSEKSSSHCGKESDLCPEGGSHDRSKDIASASIEAVKSDDLQSSTASSDNKNKLGSIPEHSEGEEELNEEEHSQSQKGLGVEISLCGNMLRPGMGRESAKEVFQHHLVCEEDFKSSGPTIIKNANLIVKFDNKYFPWNKVSHVILGNAVFGPNFSVEPVDAIPVERQEIPNSREDSLGMSPSSQGWWLWPIPSRISRSLKRNNSDSSEDIFLDTETVLSPMDEQAPENNKNQSPRKQFVRTLIPTSEQVASLNLKEGRNMVTFSFWTRVLGKQQVDAHIYLWKWNAKIVISDVDGTITRSDVLGQVMPLVGRDWSQSGVARLFSAIKENGYQLLFLSARAIIQAYLTKNFLSNLKQDGKALPNGPVVISPDGLFPSLYREVIRRAPHEFKIACLEDIKSLFPPDYNPFYAGFGNRDTDELSYKKMGIPEGNIFIINPKEDYNSWNYWKIPLPDVDL